MRLSALLVFCAVAALLHFVGVGGCKPATSPTPAEPVLTFQRILTTRLPDDSQVYGAEPSRKVSYTNQPSALTLSNRVPVIGEQRLVE